MPGSWTLFFLGIAAVILLVKNMLISDIDSKYAITDEIKHFFVVYKKGFKFLSYVIKNRGKEDRMKFSEWSKQYTSKELL